MAHQRLTQRRFGYLLGLPACGVYKIISLSSVHSIKLQHLFYTHSPTFNTQVGITSRTSSTQVRRAFLAKYWSCHHTPRSFSTLQNLRYSGYLLCTFLASSAALPTRNVRGREVARGAETVRTVGGTTKSWRGGQSWLNLGGVLK